MKIGDWEILMQPGPTPSPMMRTMGDSDWSFFGKHERTDVKKKIAEQTRMNPIDPKNWMPGQFKDSGVKL